MTASFMVVWESPGSTRNQLQQGKANTREITKLLVERSRRTKTKSPRNKIHV